MGVEAMERQLDSTRAKLRELEQEREGLASFLAQVAQGRSEFEGQLSRKRSVAMRMRSVSNAKLAQGIAGLIDDRLGGGFSGGVEGCFDGVVREGQRAINQVEEEIQTARAAISSLEDGIAAERQRMAEEARRREEEAARAAAEAARGAQTARQV